MHCALSLQVPLGVELDAIKRLGADGHCWPCPNLVLEAPSPPLCLDFSFSLRKNKKLNILVMFLDLIFDGFIIQTKSLLNEIVCFLFCYGLSWTTDCIISRHCCFWSFQRICWHSNIKDIDIDSTETTERMNPLLDADRQYMQYSVHGSCGHKY